MRVLYDLGIQFYLLTLRFLAPFREKARLWQAGRRQWESNLRQAIGRNECPIWVHCASLGEFEQGRPLIEQLKSEYPDVKIVLTFFSPSGYEIRKNYELADHVAYLPADTAQNARQFLQIVQPRLVIFVKYEFWYHFLTQLQQQQIPSLLISAIFHPRQPFFQWYGSFFRQILRCFQHIFVQNEASAQLLEQIGVENFSIAGDTRIDRVLAITKKAKRFPKIERFVGQSPVLIAGSSWPPDEAILVEFIQQNSDNDWKFIIAPHDISEKHIQQIEQLFKGWPITRYTKTETALAKASILIVDTIGMLSALYQYGKVAYIGGGFGAGIHNTLEPVAFGLPVLFGPKFDKFEEAVQLVRRGGAFVVEDAVHFEKHLQELEKPKQYEQAAAVAKNYVAENQGATEKIMAFIQATFQLEE